MPGKLSHTFPAVNAPFFFADPESQRNARFLQLEMNSPSIQPALTDPAPPKPPPRKIWRRWLLVAVGTIGVAVLALFLAADRLLESRKVRELASAKTGKILGGPAGFLPLTWRGLSVQSGGLLVQAIPPRALTEVRAKDIFARCSLVDLWRGRGRIDELSIEEIEAALGEGAVEKLTLALPTQPELLPPATEDSSFAVDIRQVSIARGTVLWGPAKAPVSGFRGVKASGVLQGEDLMIEAQGGSFQQSGLPEVQVQKLKLHFAKPRLTVDEGSLLLGEKGSIGAKGQLTFGDQPALDLKLTFQDCPLAPFLNEKMRTKLKGSFRGDADLQMQMMGETAVGVAGRLVLLGAIVQNIDALEKLAAFTGQREFARLTLQQFSGHYRWHDAKLVVDDFELEAKRLIRVEGTFEVHGKTIAATLQVGTTAAVLEKFPGAREEVFTKQRGAYFWTTVKLTSPLEKPHDDLKPRLVAAAKAHFAKKLLAPIFKPGELIIQSIETLF